MDRSHLDIVDGEIAALQHEREECEAKVRRLDAQLEFAKRMRMRLATGDASPTARPPGANGRHAGATIGPSEAIRAHLRQHPGTSRRGLVAAVANMNISSG